jgi:NAD(P)H-dependent FMN reductase
MIGHTNKYIPAARTGEGAPVFEGSEMSEQPLKVAVLIGSTREGRFGGTVARWFLTQARERADMALDVIDLADIDLPMVYPQRPEPAELAYIERIDRADAFVVITPEYNHGYPASLKQAIDLPRTQWQRKPVGFVSYGGTAGGLRAVEQLRQVFAELHAVTMRDSVSFHMAWELFDEAGKASEPSGCNDAAHTMLEHLAWWATALRTGRTADAADLEQDAGHNPPLLVGDGDNRVRPMSTTRPRVIIVGRLPEKMGVAIEVIKAHGFAATGVFSEHEAEDAIAQPEALFAVVTGGAIDAPARARLQARAAAKDAVLVTANIGHEDPKTHFTEHVIPKLIAARRKVD